MVGLTFLVLLASAGAMGILGALLLQLQRKTSWETAAISGALALRLRLRLRRFGLITPFTAALLQRYGLRRIVVMALGLVILGWQHSWMDPGRCRARAAPRGLRRGGVRPHRAPWGIGRPEMVMPGLPAPPRCPNRTGSVPPAVMLL